MRYFWNLVKIEKTTSLFPEMLCWNFRSHGGPRRTFCLLAIKTLYCVLKCTNFYYNCEKMCKIYAHSSQGQKVQFVYCSWPRPLGQRNSKMPSTILISKKIPLRSTFQISRKKNEFKEKWCRLIWSSET